MAGFVIEGLEDALRKMDEMTKNVAKKHVKKALRAAAKPVLQSAKDNAKNIDDPDTAANIAKNLVIRTGKTSDKNSAKVRIGVKGGGQFWRSNKNVQRKGKPRESNPHYTPLPNDTRHFGLGSWRHTPFRKAQTARKFWCGSSWRHTPFRKS